MKLKLDNKREANFTRATLTLTLVMFAGLYHYLATSAYDAYKAGDMRFVLETAAFATAMFFIAYGNVLYQVCLIGFYKRRESHVPATRDELDAMYEGNAPKLSVIIPSYKEERGVIWQTMMSAALSEYPQKNIVLLIDDPYHPKALADMIALEDTRKIQHELQAMFDAPRHHYQGEKEAFELRRANGRLRVEEELLRLSGHYENVAEWLHNVTADYMGRREMASLNHGDRFFVDAILQTPARKHLVMASKLRRMADGNELPDADYIARQYARLVGLFSNDFSSFERKKYVNLSHEANKAMNLNSYIALTGKSWKEVENEKGQLELHECRAEEADFTIPHADYINTIDADSLMLGEYSLRVITLMEKAENTRLAVVQSPVSSYPGCPVSLERAASACIDVQFETHQGYTHWGASFWVGANAMLRRSALEDIKEIHMENGHPVSIFIQDRTVIEDTESTIDLVHKGWKLYNYPERMTFSANPSDFGSLLIQRRRWSNGGLIILPKLFRYAYNAPKTLGLAKEMFMRFHYLASTTTGCVVALALMFYPFGDMFSTPWLILSVVPFFVLHIRDLKNNGYRASDALRICAMNLMLFPIVTGGVFKMFQQIITGKKIPFGRTPKVPGRTAAPALYSALAFILPAAFISVGMHHILQGHYSQSIFSFINASFLIYALVNFIGIKGAAEDVFAGPIARWRLAFHKAEIIPISSGQTNAPAAPMAKQA